MVKFFLDRLEHNQLLILIYPGLCLMTRDMKS